MEETKLDKREAILQATLELVAEHGFHDAPCSLIAERAGVAAGTIYRYFENKDMLILELYRELETKINTALLDGYSLDNPFRERFHSSGYRPAEFFQFYTPKNFKYVEQFHNSPYGVVFRRDRFMGQSEDCGIYVELFKQGIKQQVLKNLPLAVLCDLAFGPIISVARNHILGFVQLDEKLTAQIAAACWDALKR